MKRQGIFGLVIAALAVAILYLLNKKGMLHESVTSTIGGVTSSGLGTILPDPQTGFPVYDTRYPSTVPPEEAYAIPPLDTDGNATQFPKNALGCTCPIGFVKWKNAADGSVWCLPVLNPGQFGIDQATYSQVA